MAKKNDRIVYQTDEGWANKRIGADKAANIADTQKQAIQSATEMIKNSGGGELTVKGTDNKIRSKDTIAPGNDPNPPKDKEH